MDKRVKSVSMPGLAAKLAELDSKGGRWIVKRTVSYIRSSVANTVDNLAERNTMTGAGWDGIVAKATMDDDGLLSGYLVNSDVPYKIGRVLDTAWESLT